MSAEELGRRGYRFAYYLCDGRFRERWIHASGHEVIRLPDEEDAPVMVQRQIVGMGSGDDVRPVPPGKWICGPIRPPAFMKRGPNWTGR